MEKSQGSQPQMFPMVSGEMGAGTTEPMPAPLDYPRRVSPLFQVCSSYLLQRGMDSSKILAHLRASTCKARQCFPKLKRTPSCCHLHPQGPACLLLLCRLRGNLGKRQWPASHLPSRPVPSNPCRDLLPTTTQCRHFIRKTAPR